MGNLVETRLFGKSKTGGHARKSEPFSDDTEHGNDAFTRNEAIKDLLKRNGSERRTKPAELLALSDDIGQQTCNSYGVALDLLLRKYDYGQVVRLTAAEIRHEQSLLDGRSY